MEHNVKRELTLNRDFDASREKVFDAWTDAKKVQQWWSPKGATTPTCEWDATPNGKIYIVMKAGPDLGPMAGQEWPMTGQFKEIVAPEKIVYLAQAILNDKPFLETLTTVTFTEENGKTHMTVHIEVTMTTPQATGALQGMEMGWNQQLDKLVEFMKK